MASAALAMWGAWFTHRLTAEHIDKYEKIAKESARLAAIEAIEKLKQEKHDQRNQHLHNESH